jgi:galactose mutarotase-like enzyme
MHTLTIENDDLLCTFVSKGAELTSLYHKPTNREVLWNGDPSVWARQAPVLFPIVGKLVDNEYVYNHSTYRLPQHGFARDSHFTILAHQNNCIQFLLSSTEESLAVYPFNFQLIITYTLDGSQLTTQYKVVNMGSKNMYYSIGAHPGFKCPIMPTDTFDSCYLEFSSNETFHRILLKEGLRTDDSELLVLDKNRLQLNENLFKVKDAIVLKNIQSQTLFLKSMHHPHGLAFTAKNYSWYGIWSKPGPFICLEPWMGVADHVSHSKELTQKEAILDLDPQNHHVFEFQIDVF